MRWYCSLTKCTSIVTFGTDNKFKSCDSFRTVFHELICFLNGHTTYTVVQSSFFFTVKKITVLCVLYVHFVGLVKENKLIKLNGIINFKVVFHEVRRHMQLKRWLGIQNHSTDGNRLVKWISYSLTAHFSHHVSIRRHTKLADIGKYMMFILSCLWAQNLFLKPFGAHVSCCGLNLLKPKTYIMYHQL